MAQYRDASGENPLHPEREIAPPPRRHDFPPNRNETHLPASSLRRKTGCSGDSTLEQGKSASFQKPLHPRREIAPPPRRHDFPPNRNANPSPCTILAAQNGRLRGKTLEHGKSASFQKPLHLKREIAPPPRRHDFPPNRNANPSLGTTPAAQSAASRDSQGIVPLSRGYRGTASPESG